jgi:hypothetical protein
MSFFFFFPLRATFCFIKPHYRLRHYTTSRKVADSISDDVIEFLGYLILPAALRPLGSTQRLIEISTRNHPGSKGRPAHKTDNLAAILEPIINKMWAPRRLTALLASTACHNYRLDPLDRLQLLGYVPSPRCFASLSTDRAVVAGVPAELLRFMAARSRWTCLLTVMSRGVSLCMLTSNAPIGVMFWSHSGRSTATTTTSWTQSLYVLY